MKLKNKSFLFIFLIINLCTNSFLFAQSIAENAIKQSLEQDSIEQVTSIVNKNLTQAQNNFDKRILHIYLATVYENASMYESASDNYAKAASFALTQNDINSYILKKESTQNQKIIYNLLKKTTSYLVLDAVRCSLNAGDSATAINYLNSSIRNSKNQKINALINLYEQWAALIDAKTQSELDEIVVMLTAYSKMQSMESVLPSVLFTLWYINEDKTASDTLQKKYPNSLEANIVKGNVSLMPTPFYVFVMRNGNAVQIANEQKINEIKSTDTQKQSNVVIATNKKVEDNTKEVKAKRQQVGLFGKKENANVLVERLKEKGFKPYIETETRPSGNTYYIVIVDENAEQNMNMLLKTAGFDCYPVY